MLLSVPLDLALAWLLVKFRSECVAYVTTYMSLITVCVVTLKNRKETDENFYRGLKVRVVRLFQCTLRDTLIALLS